MCNRSGTYHLFNPNIITIQDMCNKQGIRDIPFEEFVLSLNYGDSLLTHGYYLHNSDLLGVFPYNDLTNHVLHNLGFSWSHIDQKKIALLWSNWAL